MVFFSSPAGQYVVQVLAHSLLMALVVEALIKIWEVTRPSTQLQFRLLYLLVPVMGWPVYQLLWPSRGSAEFRQTFAIIDMQQFLPLLLGGLPIWAWVSLVMGLGTVLFVGRALVPTLHNMIRADKEDASPEPELVNKLNRSLQKLGNLPVSSARIVAGPWPGAYLSGLNRSRLTVSAPLVELLDEEELEAVLAHESAHAIHRDNPRGWSLLLLGLVMFYNPVALVALQRISKDVEMACDDVAVAWTGRPLALASAILKTAGVGMGTWQESTAPNPVAWLSRLDARVRRNMVVKRVSRLSQYDTPQDVSLKWLKLALTALLSGVLLFFVV